MPKQKINLDDFIDPERKIDIGIKINPKARIVDFADIKIAAIDPNIKGGIEWHTESARKKLEKLKKLLQNQ